MFSKLSAIVLVVSIVGLAKAQVPSWGRCPSVKGVDDFQLDKYTGIWYEYSKYPFIFEFGKKCIYAIYNKIDNETISVTNVGVTRFTGSVSNVTGQAKAVRSGELAVVFPRSRSQTYDKPNYVILGTDYASYAVVYSCSSFNALPFIKTEIIWILTRERKPQAAAIDAAKQIIKDNHLSTTFLYRTNQENCLSHNQDDEMQSEEKINATLTEEINAMNGI